MAGWESEDHYGHYWNIYVKIQFNISLAKSRSSHKSLFQLPPTNLNLPSQDCVEFPFQSVLFPRE